MNSEIPFCYYFEFFKAIFIQMSFLVLKKKRFKIFV